MNTAFHFAKTLRSGLTKSPTRSLLREERWAAQGHRARRWWSWGETQVCLAPPSAPFSSSVMPLEALPALAFTHLLRDFHDVCSWGISPREITGLFWSEQSLRAEGAQMREEARTRERHHEGGWVPSSPSLTYRKKSFEHLVPTHSTCFPHFV